MRHTIAILAFFLATGARAASDTTTSRYGLIQPASVSTNWAGKVNGDFFVLDTSAASIGATNYFTPAATTTVAAPWTMVSPASWTMSGPAAYFVSGTSVTAGYFAGNGTGITAVPAASVSAGTMGNQVIASSVAASGVGASATVGSATQAPQITYGVDGRITSASNVTVTPAAGSITSGALVANVTITPGGVDLSTVTTALAGKQATGNYITALTGSVTASGPGSVAATIVNVPQSAVNLSTVTTAFSNVAADTTTLYNIKASTGIDAGMTRSKNLVTIDSALTASSTMSVSGSDANSNSLKVAGGSVVGGQLVVAGTATVQGSAFSVGGSTMTIAAGVVTQASTTVTGTLGVGLPPQTRQVSVGNPSHYLGIFLDGNNPALSTTGSDDLELAPTGTTLVDLKGSGLVGIGTTSPLAKLDDQGDASLGVTTVRSSLTVQGSTFSVHGNDLKVSGSGYVGIGIDANGASVPLEVHTSADKNTAIYNNAGETQIAGVDDNALHYVGLRIEGSSVVFNASSGGNVGIGAASPDGSLTISGISGGNFSGPCYAIESTNSNNVKNWSIGVGRGSNFEDLSFWAAAKGANPCTTGTNVLTLGGGSAGTGTNVGIGTDLPGAKLTVAGNSSFTGPATFGSSMTVVGAAQFGGVAASSFSAAGYYIPTGWTSTQLSPAGAAPAPDKIGEETRNTTINDMCISTGTSAGNWALVGSKGATGCF